VSSHSINTTTFCIIGTPSTIKITHNSSNTVVPLHNQPNLQQGKNDVEVAFTIYGIVLDVKAHLPGPKEVLHSLYYLFAAYNNLVLLLYYFIITETLEDCSGKIDQATYDVLER
jgi:hypothetical protein